MSQPAILTPFLSDAEVADICTPLVMPAAQRRYLASLGLLVKSKPNGRPLVARSEIERVLGADRFGRLAQNDPANGPNVVGLQRWAKERKNGAQAQRR